ncbi:lytic transglycosylase, catalytic [Caballeronia terrestris]|uniref:Lytic transglycosylase, catalytic n=1 Tax=Caballeronia terrestris TaxID=1226301 RepID=A0A158KDI8_9BURK|nr:lytic transglycosylase domain-containing protein [Caballeronia terrestris]SAL78501.1 lytic transglycosylase, catalytic [Caballeronia terrestris]
MRSLLVCSILLAASLTGAPAIAAAVMPAEIAALANACYPNVHPVTMGSIVAHESTNRQFAINVNGNYRLPRQPVDADEAAATIDWLQAKGMNFDVGLGQVNSANIAALGLTGRQLLDPCTNLRAATTVLTACYVRAVKDHGEGQKALLHALSCYNTGSQTRGLSNGYVKAVVAQARVLQIPALSSDARAVSGAQPMSAAAISSDKSGGKRLIKAVAATADRDDESQGAFAHGDPGAFGSEKPEP